VFIRWPAWLHAKLKTVFTMSMLQEFKEFTLKGNAIDVAVGVIIGSAFGKIVTSLVNNIFMRTQPL